MAAFSFCTALDLEILTFDSQNEQDVLLKFLRTNNTFNVNTMGTQFNIYLGAYAVKRPPVANGFFWYRTGKPTNETVNLDWYPGEPNNFNGIEMCGTIVQLGTNVGVADYPCTYMEFRLYFNNSIVCQHKYNSTLRGYSPKYLV